MSHDTRYERMKRRVSRQSEFQNLQKTPSDTFDIAHVELNVYVLLELHTPYYSNKYYISRVCDDAATIGLQWRRLTAGTAIDIETCLAGSV
jgi:hypothetical protein